MSGGLAVHRTEMDLFGPRRQERHVRESRTHRFWLELPEWRTDNSFEVLPWDPRRVMDWHTGRLRVQLPSDQINL